MKLQIAFLQVLTVSTVSYATKIFVSSYSGNITTVSINTKTGGTGNLTLTAISSTLGCLPNPSWLELDKNTSTLYCADEGIATAQANFTSFNVASNGTLTRRDEIVTLNGGVYSTIYGNGSVLALAN
jgi:6-phosphogluconolactonase (cycloisomerase 2 family)